VSNARGVEQGQPSLEKDNQIAGSVVLWGAKKLEKIGHWEKFHGSQQSFEECRKRAGARKRGPDAVKQRDGISCAWFRERRVRNIREGLLTERRTGRYWGGGTAG